MADKDTLGGLLGNNNGPYGPMGGGINIGQPLDYGRPRLPNEDGSFSTERTITVPLGGRWYNVPTIIDGVEYPEDLVAKMFAMGRVAPVGEFPTVEQATRSASARSGYIDRMRNGGR